MSVGSDPFQSSGTRCSTVNGLAAFLQKDDSVTNPHGINWVRLAIGSFLATFALCMWVMYIALIVKPPLGNFGPVTVGLVVFMIISAFAPVGGNPNPAVAFAFAVQGWFCNKQRDGVGVLFVYWSVQLAAGALAGTLAMREKTASTDEVATTADAMLDVANGAAKLASKETHAAANMASTATHAAANMASNAADLHLHSNV